MNVRVPKESTFPTWLQRLPSEHRGVLAAMLNELRCLTEAPKEPTASLTPLVQARRHRLWRMKHSHVDEYAYRLIVWFPPDEPDDVYVVFGGNKARLHDVFYNRATNESEFTVDHILRTR